jgi:hypothetical protein
MGRLWRYWQILKWPVKLDKVQHSSLLTTQSMTKNIFLDVVTKGRLLALPTNIRQGLKCLLGTNALAYFATVSMTKKQLFFTLAQGCHPSPTKNAPSLCQQGSQYR